MKVKNIRKLLDLLKNEEAEVYVVNSQDTIDDFWEGNVKTIKFISKKYVESNLKLIAKRPCNKTKDSVESLVIYLD